MSKTRSTQVEKRSMSSGEIRSPWRPARPTRRGRGHERPARRRRGTHEGRAWAQQHPSSPPSRQAISDVTYACSRPDRRPHRTLQPNWPPDEDLLSWNTDERDPHVPRDASGRHGVDDGNKRGPRRKTVFAARSEDAPRAADDSRSSDIKPARGRRASPPAQSRRTPSPPSESHPASQISRRTTSVQAERPQAI